MKKLLALSALSVLLLPGCGGGEVDLDSVEVTKEQETTVETTMDSPEMQKKYQEEMAKGQRQAGG